MARIWALAGGFVLALVVILVSGPIGGPETMLTASVGIGSGIAAVYLSGGSSLLARGLWLFAGALVGCLSFVCGGLLFPDTIIGLFLGGAVPVILLALMTMWTRRQTDYICALLGAGAITGVYANVFFVDPQGMNVSLPIAIGQTIFPMGLGFLAGVLIRAFFPDDAERDAVAEAERITQAEVTK